jgi:uncharacterized protein (TIGR00730 family)
MIQAVGVFCSSSSAVDAVFFDAAFRLGALLVRSNYTLVYGGVDVGLMGEVARSVRAEGGSVVGVVPEIITSKGLPCNNADELIVTADIRERKAVIETRSDGFIALPGGFGTLEEILEILTLKQLGHHSKPIVFINTAGFYGRLMHTFEYIYENGFARPEFRKLYHVAADPEAALEYISVYSPPDLQEKWF